MTFQIVLVCAIEEGPVRCSASYLPTAYETRALALKLAQRFEEEGACDGAYVVAFGDDWRKDVWDNGPRASFDEIPF